jgi:hypothetical protein
MPGQTPDQLWWLNSPVCLEWPEEEQEEEDADQTPHPFCRWLVELVHGMHDALASTRDSDPHANRPDRRVHATIASGNRTKASTHRRNL